MDGRLDPRPQSGPASRRKMRKGTHSCTECRRRKIRCSFHAGNTAQCTPCASRGSPCVDQRDKHADRNDPDELRERISRLESILQNQPPDTAQESTFDFQHLEIVSPQHATPSGDVDEAEQAEADQRAPFISMLHDAEGMSSTRNQGPVPPISRKTPSRHQASTVKSRRVCTSLRSALPPYEALLSTLSTNGAWWSSFRHKTHAICQGPLEGIAAFAAHAYASESPAEVGTLVTAYARSCSGSHHLFALVENLIISDLSYSMTEDGMECLLLLAKAYSDVGQPRQAWLMYRKGVAIAEMMGLHRRETTSLRRKSIWWAFYHGDRFTSLLLGLPYGFNDAHFGPSMDSFDDAPGVAEQRFILRCAFVAGKVIDRNVMPGTPSSASSMLLDEQMDAIASSMPESWWALPDQLPDSDLEIDALRDRLLQQYYFFHIRINLHLPFIARSATTVSQAAHRPAGMEASRQLLKRFVILRTQIRNQSIFDCKTSDFVGFMAVVALILGLAHAGPDSPSATLTTSDADQRLVSLVNKVFQREEQENACRIASQCRRMIDTLVQNPTDNLAVAGESPQRITIPYFGSVSRCPIKSKWPMPEVSDSAHGRPASALDQLTASPVCEVPDTMGTPYIELGSDSVSESVGISTWQFDGLEDFPVDDLSAWIDTAMEDVNQDWTELLGDGDDAYSFV